MKLILNNGLLALAGFVGLISTPAQAQSDTIGVMESQPRTQITITPRAAFYFDDFSTSGFYIETPAGGSQTETVEFPRGPLRAPLFGANISIKPASVPRLTLTFGGLYGKKKGIKVDGLLIDPRVNSSSSGLYFGRELTNLNYNRLDLEGTAQYRLNDFVALIGGVRFERGRVNFRACFENYDSRVAGNPTISFEQASEVCRQILASGKTGSQFGGTLNQLQTSVGLPILPNVTTGRDEQTNIFFTSPGRGNDGYNVITARIGTAIAVPLSESGNTSVYANGFIVGGNRHVTGPNQRRFDNAIVAGPDLAIGVAYAFNSSISLDLRYRASYLFPLSGPRNAYDPRASHGAILSLGYRL